MPYAVRILAGCIDGMAGSHLYHYELVRRLAARGHRISVICFRAVPEVHECAEVTEIPPADACNRKLLWRFASFIEYRHFSREQAKRTLGRPEVVISGEHLLAKGHWRLFPNIPWIYFPHAAIAAREIESYRYPWLMNKVSKLVYGRLQKWALNQANYTVRFTQKGCETLSAHFGASVRPHFVVNPVGVDLPTLEKKTGRAERIRLLSIGRLVPSKGLAPALNILAGLRQFAWSLDIVGDGPCRGSLETQAEAIGLANRVRFHGHCDHRELESWYHEADLFLFPSRSEGLGLVLAEAMSYGVPCLGIKADGVQYVNMNEEMIDNGSTGFLALDDVDFGRILASVFRQPEQLVSLGQAARAHIAKKHTWERHLDRYEELFEILNDRARISCRQKP